jgi:phosphinothricin acetyltransferase
MADTGPSTSSAPHGVTIRDATSSDADACAAIYTPFCTSSIVTFDLVPLTTSQMLERMVLAENHAYIVAELDGVVIGYAYAGPFHVRAAYRWSCTTSVYILPTSQGKGVGRALYVALLCRLRERGYRQAFAGITQPNPASNAIHEKMGFEKVALYKKVGWKLGKWWDVAWYQLDLGGSNEEGEPPAEPR